MATSLRVLSIQSHVVHGYVGNKSAVLPLQVLGIEVDFINSVQFSNHTGYVSIKGQVFNANELKDLYNGLKDNNLIQYTHVLTGYVGSADFLNAIAEVVSDMKSINPKLKYFCDPVLGDAGKLYVPSDLIKIYQDKILPLSDAIFPNQFEAELLTNTSIKDQQSALSCLDLLHTNYHIPTVVITSTNFHSSSNENSSSTNSILGYASRLINHSFENDGSNRSKLCLNSDSKSYERVCMTMPYLDMMFTGTGDLFAALSLAHLETLVMNKDGSVQPKYSFKEAFERVISTMQAVLKRTIQSFNECGVPIDKFNKPDLIELKIVQSIDDIRNPILGTYVELI